MLAPRSAVSAASGGSSGSAAGTQSLALVQSLSSLGLTPQQAREAVRNIQNDAIAPNK